MRRRYTKRTGYGILKAERVYRKGNNAMKKGLALLLALVLAAGLLGCGSAAGEDSRLTLARKALPDEPELTMAVSPIWTTCAWSG